MRAIGAIVLSASLGSSAWAQPADIARGKEVFKLCEGCHSMIKGDNRFGPSLAGLLGRPAGRLPGYNFSEALAGARFKWDRKHLKEWLVDEAKNMVPGTRMEFAGIASGSDVDALIAYLATVR